MALTHNLEPLIDAARCLVGEKVLFQFIGDGTKKRMLRAACESWDLRNVQFLPYQDKTRLAEVLSAADLSVVCLGVEYTGVSVPSKTYGVMACGTPILGFLAKESEIGRTIIENDCGIVLEDPTGEQVAEVIRSELRNRANLRRWGRNGRRAFCEQFTLSLAARRYTEVLERMLQKAWSRSPLGRE
jgi:glycosyltransferase involved in cell wall biosynthesis